MFGMQQPGVTKVQRRPFYLRLELIPACGRHLVGEARSARVPGRVVEVLTGHQVQQPGIDLRVVRDVPQQRVVAKMISSLQIVEIGRDRPQVLFVLGVVAEPLVERGLKRVVPV